MRHWYIGVLAGGLLVASAACDHARGDLASTGSPPMTQAGSERGPASQTPVGPLPGPPQDPLRTTNPYRGNVAAMQEGRTLFVRMNCSGCHGGRAGGGMGPSLRDVDWIYGNEEARVFSSIAEGRAHGMPAWGAMLNQDQIWKLVAYIHSLRTPQEPNQPHVPSS